TAQLLGPAAPAQKVRDRVDEDGVVRAASHGEVVSRRGHGQHRLQHSFPQALLPAPRSEGVAADVVDFPEIPIWLNNAVAALPQSPNNGGGMVGGRIGP